MSVTCWSAHLPNERTVDDLPRFPRSDMLELISLSRFPIPLPSKLLVWGKVTYLENIQGEPGPNDPPFILVNTLLHDSRQEEPVDQAYCNVNLRHPGATTVCLHAAIDAPTEHLGEPHSLSMRTELTGWPLLVKSVWLSAIELETLHVQRG